MTPSGYRALCLDVLRVYAPKRACNGEDLLVAMSKKDVHVAVDDQWYDVAVQVLNGTTRPGGNHVHLPKYGHQRGVLVA